MKQPKLEIGKDIHADDLPLLIRVFTVAQRVILRLGLDAKGIYPHPNPIKACTDAHFGVTNCWGECFIVLRFKTPEGNWLGPIPEHEVWDTLAHELAHLRYFHHRNTFWDYYEEVKKVVYKERKV